MYLTDYTSADFDLARQKADLVVLPVGSVEAHGRHLPLGTDIFSPRLFCRRLDEALGDRIWIAPEIPYGQSPDLRAYPGTIHVPSEVLGHYLYWVGRGFLENGLKKLVFLNGHGGNVTALNLAGEKLAPLGMEVMTVSWWLDYAADIVAITGGQGHAGEDETSAMLYYDSSLVHMEKAGSNPSRPAVHSIRFPGRGRLLMAGAMTGDATRATKEQGERIFAVVTQRIIHDIRLLESGQYIENIRGE